MSTEVASQVRSAIKKISPDELIGYVNSVSTGTRKGTYYNLASEQVAALNDNITKMIMCFRPFAALMTLSPSMTNDAKIATAMQLFSTKMDDRVIRKWETSIIRDCLDMMPPPKVFDMLHYMIGFRREKVGGKNVLKKTAKPVGGRFLNGIIKSYLQENQYKLDLWSVKYAGDLRKLARHLHISSVPKPKAGGRASRGGKYHEMGFLFDGEPSTPMQRRVEEVRSATEIPDALWKLPYENAKGFALNKFGMKKEEFEKAFSEKGKKTAKEARISAKRTKDAGGVDTFDPRKVGSVYELLVHLGAQDSIPRQARGWVTSVAKREAKKIGMNLSDAAVIVDTSMSMFGTIDAKRHPIFKAMSIARIVEQSVSGDFNLYFTTKQTANPIIPKLHGPTSYAQCVIKALKAGHKMIFLGGDGYENAPEGLTHRVLMAFKKKIDTDDEVSIIHLNPVQAAESLGVREITPHAPSAGISQVKSISSSMFMALARVYPVKALEAYFNELCKLQNSKTKALMPPRFQRLIGEA